MSTFDKPPPASTTKTEAEMAADARVIRIGLSPTIKYVLAAIIALIGLLYIVCALAYPDALALGEKIRLKAGIFGGLMLLDGLLVIYRTARGINLTALKVGPDSLTYFHRGHNQWILPWSELQSISLAVLPFPTLLNSLLALVKADHYRVKCRVQSNDPGFTQRYYRFTRRSDQNGYRIPMTGRKAAVAELDSALSIFAPAIYQGLQQVK